MTKAHKPFGTASPLRSETNTAIYGVEEANKLARSGRFISAIKYLEAANLDLSRERAKAIVNAFGCGHEGRWPENDHRPIRCL